MAPPSPPASLPRRPPSPLPIRHRSRSPPSRFRDDRRYDDRPRQSYRDRSRSPPPGRFKSSYRARERSFSPPPPLRRYRDERDRFRDHPRGDRRDSFVPDQRRDRERERDRRFHTDPCSSFSLPSFISFFFLSFLCFILCSVWTEEWRLTDSTK